MPAEDVALALMALDDSEVRRRVTLGDFDALAGLTLTPSEQELVSAATPILPTGHLTKVLVPFDPVDEMTTTTCVHSVDLTIVSNDETLHFQFDRTPPNEHRPSSSQRGYRPGEDASFWEPGAARAIRYAHTGLVDPLVQARFRAWQTAAPDIFP